MSHQDLVSLFEEWRAFEKPPLLDGAPDYTPERMAKAHEALGTYQKRLQAIDPDGWPVAQQVDWHVVRAEMNGFDFNCRVLMPWARDPAYYQTVWTEQSDTPAHEGPYHHAVLELWTYQFPLSEVEEARLVEELRVIPPLNRQARVNLTGNAKELWIAGIHNIKTQMADLGTIEEQAGGAASEALRAAISGARTATDEFVKWLEEQAPFKTGPSGIGKENYTWCLQNVHLVPLTWEDEVRLLSRELDRAWSSLQLEERRNQHLPGLVAAATPEEYDRKADKAASKLISFLTEKKIMDVTPNMEPTLRKHLLHFVPEEKRNFFLIGAHYDPTPIFSHFYHWWDLDRINNEPPASPIRNGALLYNIWDSRCEGVCTGVEEMYMHAGLHDDSPHSREIVWILIAQRAARGLGSLYALANEMTMEEAGSVHIEWTPRGWMSTEKELLKFEQHLYMRQPGYGSSYITGKYLFDRLLTQYSKQRESRNEPVDFIEFFREMNSCTCIPFSLIHWQMTGCDSQIRSIAGDAPSCSMGPPLMKRARS